MFARKRNTGCGWNLKLVLVCEKLREEDNWVGVLPSVHSLHHWEQNIANVAPQQQKEPCTGKLLPAVPGEGTVSPPEQIGSSLAGQSWEGEKKIKVLGLPARTKQKAFISRMDGWKKLSCTDQVSWKQVWNCIFEEKYVIKRDILTNCNNVPTAFSWGGVAEQSKCLLVRS